MSAFEHTILREEENGFVYFDRRNALFGFHAEKRCKETYGSISLRGPLALGILVTLDCNLLCKYCLWRIPGGTDNAMDHHTCEHVIRRINESDVLAVWISGGEPTLWSKLRYLVNGIEKHNKAIIVDSNGLCLSKDVIELCIEKKIHLRISLDSHIRETHDNIRGGYDKTLENIHLLLRKNIRVGIMTVVTEMNINELEGLARFLVRKGIHRWTLLELRKGFAPKTYHTTKQDFVSAVRRLRENYELSSKLIITDIHGDHDRSSLMISQNGAYFTASPESGRRYFYGNVFTQRINDFWNSGAMNKSEHKDKYLGIKN